MPCVPADAKALSLCVKAQVASFPESRTGKPDKRACMCVCLCVASPTLLGTRRLRSTRGHGWNPHRVSEDGGSPEPGHVTARPRCPLDEETRAQEADAFPGSPASHPHRSAAQALRGMPSSGWQGLGRDTPHHGQGEEAT